MRFNNDFDVPDPNNNVVSSGDYFGHHPTSSEAQSSGADNNYAEEDYMHLPAVRLTLFVCYVFVFIVGNVSNVAMMIVCLRQWREAVRIVMNNASTSNYQHHISSAVTNAFVTNLAIADIFLCVFSLTSTPYSYYSNEWPFGDFMCRFTPSTLIFAVCLVSFTSTVMAVDRHISICYPHKQWRLSIQSSLIAVAIVWIASIAACLPIFLSYHVVSRNYRIGEEMVEVTDLTMIENNNETSPPEFVVITRCEEHWQSDAYRRIFSLCVLSIQFVFPAAIIAYCYIGIFVTLQRQKRFRQGQSTKLHPSVSANVTTASSNDGSHFNLDRNRSAATNVVTSASVRSASTSTSSLVSSSQRRLWKTTVILMAMVAIFMACWMPINVLLLIADYHSETLTLWESTNWFSLAYFTSHLIAMTSTLWNPVLYGWMNERLRPEILKICFRSSADKEKDLHHRFSAKNGGNGKQLIPVRHQTEEMTLLNSTVDANGGFSYQSQINERDGSCYHLKETALTSVSKSPINLNGDYNSDYYDGSERGLLNNNSGTNKSSPANSNNDTTSSSRKGSGDNNTTEEEEEVLEIHNFTSANRHQNNGYLSTAVTDVNNLTMLNSLYSIDRFSN